MRLLLLSLTSLFSSGRAWWQSLAKGAAGERPIIRHDVTLQNQSIKKVTGQFYLASLAFNMTCILMSLNVYFTFITPLPSAYLMIALEEDRETSYLKRASQQDVQHTHTQVWDALPQCGIRGHRIDLI